MPDSGTPAFVTWVTFIIAVIGAIQPAAIALYKRYFLSRRMQIFTTFQPDIGFFDGGATFGCMGIIRNEHEISVVSHVTLDLSHAESGATLQLVAYATRNRKLTMNGSSLVPTFESSPWVPFQIAADATQLFDINFVSLSDQNAIQAILQQFRVAWMQSLNNAASQQLTSQDDLSAFVPAHFAQCQKQDFYTTALQQLRLQNWWRAGETQGSIALKVEDCSETFSTSFVVNLSADDISNLSANAEKMLAYYAGASLEVIGPAFSAQPMFERASS